VGLCREHRVLNNVLVNCSKRILFARAEANRSDGNLFDSRRDAESFCVQYPAPQAVLDLGAWQAHYGFDRRGTQGAVNATFDPDRLEVTLCMTGDPPRGVEVPEIGVPEGTTPGPFELKPGRNAYQLVAGCDRESFHDR
jgi:hypothetical protein